MTAILTVMSGTGLGSELGRDVCGPMMKVCLSLSWTYDKTLGHDPLMTCALTGPCGMTDNQACCDIKLGRPD